MSANAEIARLFDEMAAVLELTGGNAFRINAFTRAAQALRELPFDVAETPDPKRLRGAEGIGEGIARRIGEYVKTGRIAEHDELLAGVPAGLPALLAIPGLGPRTVRLLWEKGGVTDLASLRAKLESGELAKLPRLGEKSLANIRASIAFAAASSRRRLGEALPLAERIVERLAAVPGAARVAYAGSLRRGRETIGDVDILAAGGEPPALLEAFRSLEGVEAVLAAGSTKSSVRMVSGIQVDLRVVDAGAFGAALLYFTGSKEHNVALRERAIRMRLRLNEYGLFRAEAGELVESADEAAIYAALKLPWIPPELRENRGELALAETPRLIDLPDVRAELHAHTHASDGHWTIEELAREAKRRGFHTVAVTDHSKSSAQANGLSPQRLREHVAEVRGADRRMPGISILAGSEVDILADGRLDYDDELLGELDLVVASPHSSLRQDRATATRRLLKAIRHPRVHVLGHPSGRMINRREGLQPDMEAVIRAAAESGTALELNANPRRLDLRDVHVRAAVDAGALLALDTDAHRAEHMDYLRYGVLTGRRGWLTPQRCINTWSRQKLRAWLRRKTAAPQAP